jgi:PhoH-like ATPase
MVKIFVLDTSVILDDSNAIFSFKDSVVYLTTTVIEELDDKKKKSDDVGRNARDFIRLLDSNTKDSSDLSKGIKIENGPTLKVFIYDRQVCENTILKEASNNDDRILQASMVIQEANKKSKVFLVTQDAMLRVKAKAYGLNSISFDNSENIKKDENEFYAGFDEIVLKDEEIVEAYAGDRKDEISSEFILKLLNKKKKYYTNQFIKITDSFGKILKEIKVIENGGFSVFKKDKRSYFGIKPANKEQEYALNLLFDKDISFVTLLGKAGSGKTLLTLVAAISQIKDKTYDRLVITKPMVSVGKEIGFLPGSKEEKIHPWMGSIYDNLRVFMTEDEIDDHIRTGKIEFEALSFFRGRSIPNAIIFIDEAQNTNKTEAKTLLTRAGKDSKVIMTACISQIDNNYVDCITNGASHCVERLKDVPFVGHITLKKGERSSLADIAEELL